MGNCTKCVHKPVCELWRNEECQDASNYSESADCDYYVEYGMTPEDAATIGRFREHIFSVWSYAHMAEIAKAESEGRLIVLPCGDEVELEYKGLTYKADHWNPPMLTAFANCPTSPSGEKVHLFSPEEAKAALVKEAET